MKKWSLIIFLLYASVAGAQDAKLKEVRKMYYKASEESGEASSLHEKLKNQTVSDNAVLYGYKGMSLLLICHHSYNPYKKLKYFADGRDILEEAIKKSSGERGTSFSSVFNTNKCAGILKLQR